MKRVFYYIIISFQLTNIKMLFILPNAGVSAYAHVTDSCTGSFFMSNSVDF
jgi:hypothetical protein